MLNRVNKYPTNEEAITQKSQDGVARNELVQNQSTSYINELNENSLYD